MSPCSICRNLEPTAITEDESCKLQDWDRMQALADEGCEGCKFFGQVLGTYSGEDHEYAWGRFGFTDAYARRHSLAVQALVVDSCSSCTNLLTAINARARLTADDGEDWDTFEDDEEDNIMDAGMKDLNDLARQGCSGCQALLAESKTKATCLVKNTPKSRKGGFTMIIDGYESARALECLLELCTITSFEFAPWTNTSTEMNQLICGGTKELSFNRLIDTNPGTDILQMWMHLCSLHTTCGVPHDMPLPTRVIDIGTVSRPTVRLHITNGLRGQYIALSHCWGKSHMVKTTSAVIEQFLDRIEFTTLPRNFQDAITIARNMGFKYLWIDSLCIIQDSSEDWAQESTKMAFVYAQATITIAAMAAKDSEGGILRPRNAFHSHLLGPEKSFVFRQKPISWNQVHNLPLSSRAWTLQEQHLSRRILYFTDEQIFWECDTSVYAECYRRPEQVSPSAQKLRIPGLVAMARRHLLEAAVVNTDSQSLNERYVAWYSIVQEYSLRALTYSSDKLPAISGLAQVIGVADHRLGEYMAGLWESDLLRGLKWMTGYRGVGANARTSPSLRRIADYTAPSWSWAAYEGPISYGSTCELDSIICDFEFYERTRPISELYNTGEQVEEQGVGVVASQNWPKEHRTYVVCHKIILATEHNFGRVLPGSFIILSGLTRQVFSHVKSSVQGLKVLDDQVSEPCFFDSEAYGWETGRKHTWYWTQPEHSPKQLQQYTVLQVAANTQSGGLFSLILKCVKDGEVFERVGFTNIGSGLPWEKDGCFRGWNPNDWERRELKLI